MGKKMAFNQSRSIYPLDLNAIPESEWKPYLVVVVSIATLSMLILKHVKTIIQRSNEKKRKKNRQIELT